jgi:hypothetical protein
MSASATDNTGTAIECGLAPIFREIGWTRLSFFHEVAYLCLRRISPSRKADLGMKFTPRRQYSKEWREFLGQTYTSGSTASFVALPTIQTDLGLERCSEIWTFGLAACRFSSVTNTVLGNLYPTQL